MKQKLFSFFGDVHNRSLTLWVAAFLCALYPVNAWQLWWFAAAIMLLFLWSFQNLYGQLKNGWSLPNAPILCVAGAFWGLAAFSIAWSEVKPVSIMAFCFFSAMPLVFFSSLIGAKDSFYKGAAALLAFVFAVLSFWAIIQFFFLNNYFAGQARHPLADPSSLGALFSLALFCSLGWLLYAGDKPVQRRAAAGLSLALICGMIATAARGPMLALVVTLPVFFWLLYPQVKQHKKILGILLVCAVCFYGLTKVGIEKRLDIGSRIFGTFASGFEAEHSRLNIWTSTIEMIKDHPLTGTGIGTFFLYYPEYRLNTSGDTVYLAHNDPLQFFAEMGVLSPILFYAFILLAALRTIKALKILQGQPTFERHVIVTLFCASCAMVLHSHVAFNHYNLSILMLEGIMLAAWFTVTGRVLHEKSVTSEMPKSFPATAGGVLLAVPYVIIGWMLMGHVLGEHFANRASRDLFSENMLEFAQDVNKAGRVTHDQNARVYLLAVNVPMAILDFKKDSIKAEEAQKLYEQIKGYMDRVIVINPRSAPAQYYLGKVQTMVPDGVVPKDTPTPEHYYKEALRLDKTHLGARLALLKIYEDRKTPRDEQIAMMEEGIHFNYTMPIARDYYGALARLYLEAGSYEKSNLMLKKILAFDQWMEYSRLRQNTSIPQAITGGDDAMAKMW